jgi:hypothetical protein
VISFHNKPKVLDRYECPSCHTWLLRNSLYEHGMICQPPFKATFREIHEIQDISENVQVFPEEEKEEKKSMAILHLPTQVFKITKTANNSREKINCPSCQSIFLVRNMYYHGPRCSSGAFRPKFRFDSTSFQRQEKKEQIVPMILQNLTVPVSPSSSLKHSRTQGTQVMKKIMAYIHSYLLTLSLHSCFNVTQLTIYIEHTLQLNQGLIKRRIYDGLAAYEYMGIVSRSSVTNRCYQLIDYDTIHRLPSPDLSLSSSEIVNL